MLFNSYIFIFAFLPLTLLGFFTIAKYHGNDTAKLWLTGASLCFYAWLGKEWVFLLLASACFNFILAKKITAVPQHLRSYLLSGGILANVGLLAYFKYNSSIINALNLLFNQFHFSPQLILPLAISYFTFHQIAYLVDVRIERITPERQFTNYLFFITFFPHLLAGPIVYYRDIMPQFLATLEYHPDQLHHILCLHPVSANAKIVFVLLLPACNIYRHDNDRHLAWSNYQLPTLWHVTRDGIGHQSSLEKNTYQNKYSR